MPVKSGLIYVDHFKRRIVMQDNYMTLLRVLDLFDQKHINEKGLNLDWKPGTIASGIRRQFNLLKRSTFTDRPLNTLVVELPGFFDKGQDRVNFAVTFHYNAQTDELKPRFVKATMDGGIKKLFIIGNPEKMISSLEMYNRLNKLRSHKALLVFQQINQVRPLSKTKHL